MRRILLDLFFFTLGTALGAVLADRINESRRIKETGTFERRTNK